MAITLEPEDEEQDISVDAVKAFIAEQEESVQNTTEASDKNMESISASTEHNEDKVSYSFEADNTFSSPSRVEEINEMIVGVNAQDIKVTSEDQRLYLKAILNDVPVRLDVPVLGGTLIVTCRTLSVVESEKVITLVLKYFEAHPELSGALMADYIRQLRTLLQVDKINNKSVFETPVLDESLFSSEVWTEIRTMPMTKFNALSAALNVFEHKISRMNSAALNEDFWHPGETD